MFRRKIMWTVILLCCLMTAAGCKKDTETAGQVSSEPERSIVVSRTASEPTGRQTISQEIEVAEKPEVTALELTADCDGDIRELCRAEAYYPGHVMVSSTVGLVGAPIYITGTDALENAVLTLTYNEKELRGVPERNLRLLHFPEELDDFDLRRMEEPDTEHHTVSGTVSEDGYYLLVDLYEYGTAMGVAVSDYAYAKDKTDFISDWEREGYTGDIIKLTDKEWVKQQKGSFTVTTPEQLAGVVYYTNVLAKNETVRIVLENDLDLVGYRWAPMGWNSDAGLTIDFDGQGHTIKNLNINIGLRQHAGLIGYAAGIVMKDVNFESVYIKGGLFVGAIAGQCHLRKDFTNVNVSGKVYGEEREAGAYIGAGSKGSYVNCNNRVFVNDKRSPFYSSEDRISAMNADDSLYTVTMDEQGNITRDEGSEEIRSGARSFRNLTWVLLDGNGAHILSRLAENETTLPQDILERFTKEKGHYTLHLEAWDSAYIRVSNILEWDVE